MSVNRRIYVVGLTGGIASGKSEAARHLETLGATCIDADAISHRLTAENGELLPALRETFGEEVFFADGTLNRRALGETVFSDPIMRRQLDAIAHPAIQKAMMDEMKRAADDGDPLVFLNVPLLFETGMDALCDETWLISLDPERQKERLMARDGLTAEQADARISAQMPLADKEARATVVIDNRRSLDKMYSELTSLFNALYKRVSRMENE